MTGQGAGPSGEIPGRPPEDERGRVVSIHLASARGAPTRATGVVRAVPGRGLEGDRNFRAPPGPTHEDPGEELTLFAAEVADAVRRDHGIEFQPADSRRNVITEGVELNDLVGREFRLGDVLVRGLELCEPCLHLTKLCGEPRVLRALVHRGGLRAQILTEGWIRVGDTVIT